jgi:hypothetical protein
MANGLRRTGLTGLCFGRENAGGAGDIAGPYQARRHGSAREPTFNLKTTPLVHLASPCSSRQEIAGKSAIEK